MTIWTLIRRSLRFHWRSHAGVVLGAAIASAALVGALVVGDSVRHTLRERALARLGNADNALYSADRFFTHELGLSFAGSTGGEASATLLLLHGTAANQEGSARANNVQVFGVRNYFDFVRPLTVKTNSEAWERWRGETDLPHETVLLNEALASQLGVRAGDTVLLRIQKPSALSRDAVITPQTEHTVALRLRVNGIVDSRHGGDLDLQISQIPRLNAFVRLDDLSRAAAIPGKANLILAGVTRSLDAPSPLRRTWLQLVERITGKPRDDARRVVDDLPEKQLARLNARFQGKWSLQDAELRVRAVEDTQVEVSTPRIFLDDVVWRTAIATTQAVNQTRTLPPAGNARAPAPVSTNYVVVERSDFEKAKRNGILPLNLTPPQSARNATFWLEPSTSIVARAVRTLTGSRARATPAANIVMPADAQGILTYLVNQFRTGTNSTPYSMVTAAGPPLTPPAMRDDEIIVNEWLAEDLQVKPGDSVSLTYFLADQVSTLEERTNVFRVHSIVPLEGIYADKTLMPEFPGLAKAESTHDWDAGFPLVHKIRDKDETYWKQHRGTPKAFVTLAAGQGMWSNRFGALTAVRWTVPESRSADEFAGLVQKALMQNLNPADLGYTFTPVRRTALAAAEQSQDFGGLFIGFSVFLIAAALILTGLLFQFGIEQRVTEIGTLLALGFPPARVRRLFLIEGAALALIGSILGVAAGFAYARLMLRGLTTVWSSAVNTTILTFHAAPRSLAIGLVSAAIVATITIWLVLRKQGRQPARQLLAGDNSEERRPGRARSRIAALHIVGRILLNARAIASGGMLLGIAAVALALWRNDTSNPIYFFSGGSLSLVAGLALTSLLLAHWLQRESARRLTAASLSVRGAARRRKRSLATVALLACGVFLIVAIGAFRLDAGQNAGRRSSGTGGFALIGESTLPIVKDLNTAEGRDALGLDETMLTNVAFVPFRVRDGDDASCLNLNRAQQPRLLGVKPALLRDRQAFSFAKVLAGSEPARSAWSLLTAVSGNAPAAHDEIPAIADAASIQWALGKKLGDTLLYRDERGQEFKVRLVGALANSILQGSLIIDEAEFTRRFPSLGGYRMFLVDCPSNTVPDVAATLSRALEDYGMELTPAARRLAAFNAVQNTYLGTFQVLGGIGLLLGSAGLGIVVLRNVLERRAELALLIAVGFRKSRVQALVLLEHAALLCLGLAIGMGAALLAILPGLLSPRAELPWRSLAITVGGVLLFGVLSTWLATRATVRGNLLEGLRNE